jgi:hypothetical protein
MKAIMQIATMPVMTNRFAARVAQVAYFGGAVGLFCFGVLRLCSLQMSESPFFIGMLVAVACMMQPIVIGLLLPMAVRTEPHGPVRYGQHSRSSGDVTVA